jgi:sulfate/thiosulfate transport system permease protein
VATKGTKKNVLPGFGLSMGFTLTYMGLLVMLPLSTLILMTAKLSWDEFWTIVTAPRTLAAYKLSIGGAVVAALINTFFGIILAWVLVRYRFPGRRIMDALVDLPFALPTAVAGIALTAVYADNGWVGQWIGKLGIDDAFNWAVGGSAWLLGLDYEPWDGRLAYNQIGIVIAMILVSLPFVVRTVQPVLADMEPEMEQAAASLGARRWTTFRRVIMPTLMPAILTGLALSFAKSVGEYGSIIFISSNLPQKTEIAPLLIYLRLEEFNYPAAAAIAVGMLAISFVMLLVVNLLQAWSRRSAA